MNQKLRLMCVLAHPDDESLGTGGILARYSNQEDTETFLLTATRGEAGRYGSLAEHPGREAVGRIREGELRKAAETLGVKEVSILGYEDGLLDQADAEGVIQSVVFHLRRVRPDVVVTFAPDGAYGHPDHIAISQFTIAAITRAADPDFVVDMKLGRHQVSKAYFLAWGADQWKAYQSAFKELSVRVDGRERQANPWPDWAITTRIDTKDRWPVVWEAVRCHKTQLAVYGKLEELEPADHARLWGCQEFYRVFSLVNGGRETETDLFEGLRAQESLPRKPGVRTTTFGTDEPEGKVFGNEKVELAATRDAVLDMAPEQFRKIGNTLVNQVADLLESLPYRRVTVPQSPADVRQLLDEARSVKGRGAGSDRLFEWITEKLFDHSLHNGHPRFWGYVTSSAAPIGMLGDFLAAAVNPNVGAWKLSPLASEIEGEVIRQIAELLDYPANCGGLLVSGGNMANFVGFMTARYSKTGPEIRKHGTGSLRAPLRVYASQETHTWVEKAADLTGLGTDCIRWIETDAKQRIDAEALERYIKADLANGDSPFLVVGTVGTVSTGAVDPISDLKTICDRYDLWLHVDGAYGAPAALLDDVPPGLKSLRLADSVAMDPHKWMYAPLEAGCVLVKEKEILKGTFSYHPPYYHFDEECTNYFDFGPQNSRGFRALKVWLILQIAGRDGLRKMITDDIKLAAEFYKLAEEEKELEPLTQELSITTFRYVPERFHGSLSGEDEEYLTRLNQELLFRIEDSGEAFLSNALINGRFALRLCVVNFRTSLKDIRALPEIVIRHGRAADEALRPEFEVTGTG